MTALDRASLDDIGRELAARIRTLRELADAEERRSRSTDMLAVASAAEKALQLSNMAEDALGAVVALLRHGDTATVHAAIADAREARVASTKAARRWSEMRKGRAANA